MRLKGKSSKVQAFESGQEAQKKREFQESRNLDTLGRRFADLTEFLDSTGRSWVIASYWGIGKSGAREGKRTYYLTAMYDIGGKLGYYYRIRTEDELIQAQTDATVLLTGVEKMQYQRLHDGH